VAGAVRDDLLERMRSVTAAAARVRALGDAEAIHDLRVALRRLNAALRLWRDLLRPAPRTAARRRLRRLRRALGPARELEVNVAQLLEFLPAMPPPSRVAVESLAARLRGRLPGARARAARAARPSAIRALARRVERSVSTLPERLATRPDPRTIARQQIARAREVALRALGGAVETGDDAHLHQARIAVKKWRYAVESAQAALDSTAKLKSLRDVQEVLGQVHDRAVLRDLIERRARKLRAAGLEAQATGLLPLLQSLETDRVRRVETLRALAAKVGAAAAATAWWPNAAAGERG
jgi:CHAD domain-containing protein